MQVEAKRTEPVAFPFIEFARLVPEGGFCFGEETNNCRELAGEWVDYVEQI